jgi:hypothetical protein
LTRVTSGVNVGAFGDNLIFLLEYLRFKKLPSLVLLYL